MAGDFTKLFHKFFRSSISKETSDTRILFLGMISLCDENGVVESTIDGIARHVALPYETAVAALERLQAPDPDSTTPDEEGRRVLRLGSNRWLVVTFRQYWELQKKEERREYLAEAKRRQRERERSEGDASTSVNTSQHESTGVAEDHHPSLSLSSSLSQSSSSKLEESPLFKNRPIQTGPKEKKANPQAERVRLVEQVFEEYGAKPVPPNLIAKWIGEFEIGMIERTLRQLGIRGALMKGPEYIYASLKNAGGENANGRGIEGKDREGASGGGGKRKGKFSEYDR